MKKNLPDYLLSTLLLIVVYVVNYGATRGSLGVSMMNLRDIFPFEYMPAGWTFGVAWGSIYLALAVYLIWSWTREGRDSIVQQKIQPLFRVTCVLNILWIYLTSWSWFGRSVVVIIALMLVLWRILGIIHSQSSSQALRIPFGLYTGWITIATSVVGISQLLYTSGWTFVTAPRWTIVTVGCGLIMAGRVYRSYRNRAQLAISLVAFAGVAASLLG